MKIPDSVIADARAKFVTDPNLTGLLHSAHDESLRAFISAVVERSIDYEALADFLTGKLFGLRTRDGAMRGAHAAMHAALGIGGDVG